jgi:hypothetical protein
MKIMEQFSKIMSDSIKGSARWIFIATKKFLLWTFLVILSLIAGTYLQYFISPIMASIFPFNPHSEDTFPCSWGHYATGGCGIWTRDRLNLPSAWQVFFFDTVVSGSLGTVMSIFLWVLVRKKGFSFIRWCIASTAGFAVSSWLIIGYQYWLICRHGYPWLGGDYSYIDLLFFIIIFCGIFASPGLFQWIYLRKILRQAWLIVVFMAIGFLAEKIWTYSWIDHIYDYSLPVGWLYEGTISSYLIMKIRYGIMEYMSGLPYILEDGLIIGCCLGISSGLAYALLPNKKQLSGKN